MPASLVNPETSSDPRMQKGAYVTDGRELYLITGSLEEPTQRAMGARIGAPVVTLEAENCKTGYRAKLDVSLVRRGCTLVKAAPS